MATVADTALKGIEIPDEYKDIMRQVAVRAAKEAVKRFGGTVLAWAFDKLEAIQLARPKWFPKWLWRIVQGVVQGFIDNVEQEISREMDGFVTNAVG